VSQGCDPCPPSKAHKDAGDAIKISAGEMEVKPVDISGLCLYFGNLCLDVSRNTMNGSVSFDRKDTAYNSNSSSDIPIPASKADASISEKCVQVTNHLEDSAGASAGDSIYVLKESENCSLRVIGEPDNVESHKEIPVLLEAAKAVDAGVPSVKENLRTSAENIISITETTEINKKTEGEFNETVKHNHTDSRQTNAQSHQIKDVITFELENTKKSILKEHVPCHIENIQVCQGTVNINETQEEHIIIITGDSNKSDVPLEISQTDAEDGNLAPVETPLYTNVKNPVQETNSLLESKQSADFDSSECTESRIHKKKSKPEAGLTLISDDELQPVSLVIAPTTAIFLGNGAGDWRLQVEKEQEAEFMKETCTVLSKLFEICNCQHKDLELGGKEFINGKEFFASLYKSVNVWDKDEHHIPHGSIKSEFENVLDCPVPGELPEFDQRTAEEAEKIVQEIINAYPEFHETGLRASGSICSSSKQTNSQSCTEVMTDLRGRPNSFTTDVEQNGDNPFVSQASLCQSLPPDGKPSPRSSSNGLSPCDSPHTNSKLSSVNARTDSPCSHDYLPGDDLPNSHSGKSSPVHRISSNKVSKVFGAIILENY